MTLNRFIRTFFILFGVLGFAQNANKALVLFDQDLSQFEKWIGIPHTTVKDLPEGTFTSIKVTEGNPLGLNNDIKNIFTQPKPPPGYPPGQ